MHNLIKLEDGHSCSKCGKPATHFYKLNSRGYGSIFDDIDEYRVQFHLCDDCNREDLDELCDENPTITNGEFVWIKEESLMEFINTFPSYEQEIVLNGEYYINTYNAYIVSAQQTYAEMIAKSEV